MPESSKAASLVEGVPARDIPPSGVKPPAAWPGYATVAGGWLAIFAAGMVLSSFGVFFKPVSTQFDWTRAETSGAFSLAQVVSGMAGVAAGRLGDRFNPRLIIVLCGAVLGTAYLLLSRIDALWQLYFYYGILVGCGIAVIIPVSSLIARTFAAQRGLFTGLTMSGGAVGTAIAAPLATLFINHYGWRGSYLAIGVIALVLGLITSACFYYAARFKPVSSTGIGAGMSRPRTDVSGSTLKQAFSSGQFWGLGMILFCSSFVLQTFAVHVIPRATDVGISTGDAALILTIGNGVSMIGSFVLGSSNDRIGSATSLVIALVLLFAASTLLLFASSLSMFYAFAVGFGLAIGGTATLRPIIVAERFGLQAHGVITGAILLIAATGGTIGPLITGYIFDLNNTYSLAFSILVGVNLLGLALAVLMAPRRAVIARTD